MAKKSKKLNQPNWIKSKYFILGFALFAALGVAIGLNSFAATVIPTPCLGGTTKPGDKGSCVVAAQKVLAYSCKGKDVKIDGRFGNTTRDKVKGFQYAAGVPADGKIGPVTWNNLYHYRTSHKKDSLNCVNKIRMY